MSDAYDDTAYRAALAATLTERALVKAAANRQWECPEMLHTPRYRTHGCEPAKATLRSVEKARRTSSSGEFSARPPGFGLTDPYGVAEHWRVRRLHGA